MKKITLFVFSVMLITTSAFAHSDAFKPAFVDTLINPYLTVQKALARDDLEAAQKGAELYLKAMKHAPHEGKAHEEAMNLSTPATAIAGASDIKLARTDFLTLSQEITYLVQHIGTTKETPLFIAHCPMAFDSKGGSWLQSDKTVANPYYGSMMLRCGSIKKQITGDKQSDHDGQANGASKPAGSDGDHYH